jgi:ribonuclease PH
MTSNGEITHIQLDGKISSNQLKEAIELAKKGSKEVYEIQKKALKNVGEEIKNE